MRFSVGWGDILYLSCSWPYPLRGFSSALLLIVRISSSWSTSPCLLHTSLCNSKRDGNKNEGIERNTWKEKNEWLLHVEVLWGSLKNDGGMRSCCQSCCFFLFCSSAWADCLLGLASSTAGYPLGILAVSPCIGVVVTMVIASWLLLLCHCVTQKYVTFNQVRRSLN